MKVIYKNESFLMKLISWVLFFNKDFMAKYATTIGETVYLPEDSKKWSKAQLECVLAHEQVHILDYKKDKYLFSLKYLFPQILILLGLLILPFSIWFALTWMIFFALPLPAPWRMYYELRGYNMSLIATYILLKERNASDEYIFNKLNKLVDIYNGHFITFTYYLMWPFGVKNKLKQTIKKIKSDDILLKGSVYEESYKTILINYRQD